MPTRRRDRLGRADQEGGEGVTEKRVIWLVTDYGGEWEDKWEWNVRAFSDEAMAKECAERHEMRMKRDMGEYDDYCGTAVECVELVDAPNRSK